MLVLSRSEGESLLIGDDVVVTITRIKGDNVRIGISAPKDVQIIRTELPGKESDNAVQNSQPD